MTSWELKKHRSFLRLGCRTLHGQTCIWYSCWRLTITIQKCLCRNTGGGGLLPCRVQTLGRLWGQPEARLRNVGWRKNCAFRPWCSCQERVNWDCCHSIPPPRPVSSPPIPRTLFRAIHKEKKPRSPWPGTFATSTLGEFGSPGATLCAWWGIEV